MLLKTHLQKFRFLKLGANHADLHILKLTRGKAKGNYLPAKSQSRQILMNELILLFTAVLQDKAWVWQGNYLSKPFVFIIQTG